MNVSDKFATRTFLGGLFCGILATEALYFAVKWIRTELLEPAERSKTHVWHRVLFFPDSKPSCRNQYLTPVGCGDKRCRYAHKDTAFLQLMHYLTSGKHSLDLCVYCITSPELGDAIMQLHSLGIRVRVITDGEQADSTGSQIGKFRAAGIQVRQGERSFYMHHKFAVVDKTILINGSFNWTRNAVLGNNENLHITNDSYITSSYLEEFEKIWQKYDPVKGNTIPTLQPL